MWLRLLEDVVHESSFAAASAILLDTVWSGYAGPLPLAVGDYLYGADAGRNAGDRSVLELSLSSRAVAEFWEPLISALSPRDFLPPLSDGACPSILGCAYPASVLSAALGDERL